jgi:hypothetical protein
MGLNHSTKVFEGGLRFGKVFEGGLRFGNGSMIHAAADAKSTKRKTVFPFLGRA